MKEQSQKHARKHVKVGCYLKVTLVYNSFLTDYNRLRKKALHATLLEVKTVARCYITGHRTSFQYAISSTVTGQLDFQNLPTTNTNTEGTISKYRLCVILITVRATKTPRSVRFSYNE
jgi:hypothetical protein